MNVSAALRVNDSMVAALDEGTGRRFPLTTLAIHGINLSDDVRGIENGLVGWVEGCADALARNGDIGDIGDYYRHELGFPPTVERRAHADPDLQEIPAMRTARKPSATSRVVGYHYEGTIIDLPRIDAILRRAQETNLVTQCGAKQYGRRGEGCDCVWFNGPPGPELRKVRDAVRALVEVHP